MQDFLTLPNLSGIKRSLNSNFTDSKNIFSGYSTDKAANKELNALFIDDKISYTKGNNANHKGKQGS